jgi:GrpB-like predicted nucleotidyltransferase (UPF0157 family)
MRQNSEDAEVQPLGLESGVVRLAEYDERWPSLFAAEARHIFAFSEDIPLRLEHIGSTSVPGMCAKPVLDILAGRPSATPVGAYVVCFQRAGYDYRGEQGVAGREFFRRGQPRAYHVHLVEEGGVLWREYLALRDYLRAHAEAAARYGDLKRSLAARFPLDREAYTNGKTALVREIVGRAIGAP